MQFDSEEFLKLSRELEKHHSIFYRLWHLGKPIFTDDPNISRAAVSFDQVGEGVNFLLNYDFWSKLNWQQKQFVICHESLHIIFNHGARILNINKSDFNIVNIALDIVVNHCLITRFDFNRKEVDPDNVYCWLDNIFPNRKNVLLDKSFEYYYNLLAEQNDNIPIATDHKYLEEFAPIIKKLNEEMSGEEKEGLKELIEQHFAEDSDEDKEAGAVGGNKWIFADCGTVPKKKKWETIIKEWAKKHDFDIEEENWIKKNKRMVSFLSNLMLPSEAEVDNRFNDKLNLCFFQDTSGSCVHLAHRFFAAAKSIPADHFDITLCSFDTKVYEVDKKNSKLQGFGGTSFNCIENYIQQKIKNSGCKYFDAIFIITDGYGDKVLPKFPEKWYWFLSTPYTKCIPEKSKIFYLKDYE